VPDEKRELFFVFVGKPPSFIWFYGFYRMKYDLDVSKMILFAVSKMIQVYQK